MCFGGKWCPSTVVLWSSIFTYENFFKTNTTKTYFVSITNIAFSFIKKKKDTSIPNEKKNLAILIKKPEFHKGKSSDFHTQLCYCIIFQFLEHHAMWKKTLTYHERWVWQADLISCWLHFRLHTCSWLDLFHELG